MGAFVLHRPLHSMLTCSCFPAVLLFWAEHRCLLRRVSVRYASVFVLFFVGYALNCALCFGDVNRNSIMETRGWSLHPPPYLRALEIENRRTAPELQQHNNELFSLQMYVITSSVSQVRIPKFVRVLYGVRSVSQRFSTLLLNCSALCELNSFFYSLCLNHASECPPKQTVGPKMAVFRPFHRGKKAAKRCWNISIYIYVLCLSCLLYTSPSPRDS